MADYKETAVSGKQWTRCDSVLITNPHNATPEVQLTEQTVAIVGDNKFVQTAAGIRFAFDPTLVINLRHPQSGELVGASMTGMDLYVALYSLYIQKALERDAT